MWDDDGSKTEFSKTEIGKTKTGTHPAGSFPMRRRARHMGTIRKNSARNTLRIEHGSILPRFTCYRRRQRLSSEGRGVAEFCGRIKEHRAIVSVTLSFLLDSAPGQTAVAVQP